MSKSKKQKRGFAVYDVLDGWGYAIEIWENGKSEPIAEYSAGDSAIESQTYATGDTDKNTLVKWAKQTAREMMKKLEIVGKVGNGDVAMITAMRDALELGDLEQRDFDKFDAVRRTWSAQTL